MSLTSRIQKKYFPDFHAQSPVFAALINGGQLNSPPLGPWLPMVNPCLLDRRSLTCRRMVRTHPGPLDRSPGCSVIRVPKAQEAVPRTPILPTCLASTQPPSSPQFRHFPPELSRPNKTLTKSHNPLPPNHFRSKLYHNRLGSFGNFPPAQTAQPPSLILPVASQPSLSQPSRRSVLSTMNPA